MFKKNIYEDGWACFLRKTDHTYLWAIIITNTVPSTTLCVLHGKDFQKKTSLLLREVCNN
ncbi:hypothetical protein J2X69_000739 [Algoriphagus sp. 4150]|nr:hypothetical protein [Algoriphagus sp. 4150]